MNTQKPKTMLNPAQVAVNRGKRMSAPVYTTTTKEK